MSKNKEIVKIQSFSRNDTSESFFADENLSAKDTHSVKNRPEIRPKSLYPVNDRAQTADVKIKQNYKI